jgi:hypothetical protein
MLREHPLGREKASLTFSSVVCLGGFGLCCFVGFGFEGFFLGCGCPLLSRLGLFCSLGASYVYCHVYLEAPYAFYKLHSYLSKKKKGI